MQVGEGGYSFVYLVRELPSTQCPDPPPLLYALKKVRPAASELHCMSGFSSRMQFIVTWQAYSRIGHCIQLAASAVSRWPYCVALELLPSSSWVHVSQARRVFMHVLQCLLMGQETHKQFCSSGWPFWSFSGLKKPAIKDFHSIANDLTWLRLWLGSCC